MSEVSPAIARWLEQERRTDRIVAGVISGLALGAGTVVFLLMSLLVYGVLWIVFGAFFGSLPWLGPAAMLLMAGFFFNGMKSRPDERQVVLDPMGYWILKDLCLMGPRLVLEGLRQVRRCGQLGELNVTACARALTYLAAQNRAVTWQELMRHCPQEPWPRLREQLALLDGVLFLGRETERVTLMDPFRVRLRWLLEPEQRTAKGQEPPRPRPEPSPQAIPVNEPEKLTAYEILGLSPSASAVDIKTAYRKRMKECHPDLFAGMDLPAQALAERWTKALNVAYETLNPRRGRTGRSSARPR
jgi:DnaJ-domain-containing protein 1